MNQDSGALFAGQPRFGATALPKSEDAGTAWRRLIELHGPEKAAANVEGDFAVALPLEDGRCFLAVDRFSEHTLCYRIDEAGISFALRADQLARNPNDLDPQALFDYLYFHVIPSPRTVFRGVMRLPPGYYALFEKGKLTVAPYWTPTFTATLRPSFSELRDEFRLHLHRAVSRQLDGSPPACFLSGGTDSSTVAGMIGQATGTPASTYSIGFEAEGYDEMAYARLAAKHFGTKHHEYYVTPSDLVASIGKVAASFDQPFGNSSAVPTYYCALQAKQDGVTRMLAGDGGDELFGGNSRYAMQRIFSRYTLVPAAVRSGLLEPFFGLPWVGRTPLLKKGSGYIKQARTPLPARLQTFNLLRRLGYTDVLTPDFLSQIEPAGVVRQQRAVWDGAHSPSEIDLHLAYDWRYTLAESDLPKVRGATELAGMSVGYPMLDDDLLAFSMRLPAEYKLKGLKLRWFFKEALRGFLPDDILTKKKQGFGLPFGVWAVQNPGLKALAEDSVRSLAQRGIVRADFVHKLMSSYLPEHPSYYGTMVWILMILEQWLQTHAPDYKFNG
jgi:asparagine synthase (glutamine-hydrolysing)